MCSTCHLRCPAKRLPRLPPRPPENRHPSIQELYSEWRCQTSSNHTPPPAAPPPSGYQYIPHACSQADGRKYLTLAAREQAVNSYMLRLRNSALRRISLDQRLSDFHFKGESLPLLPPLCTEDCIYDFILFQVFFFVSGLIMIPFVLTNQRHYIQSG